MMNNIRDIVVVIVLIMAILAIGATVGVFYVIPQCQEDQVLLGTGDFQRGRWTRYECGPAADDFAPFSDIQLQACGEGWYQTMGALKEALVRLEE